MAAGDSCWWHVAFDHIRPTLHYGSSIHHGVFDLGLACATSQVVMGWESAGLGVVEVGRGQRLSPDQEEDHRWCPGSCTHPQPQGTLQSCAVHVRIQKRLPHLCTFALLSLVFSLRDFRARRSSLLPAPSPCPPVSHCGDPHRNPSDHI